MDFAPISKLLLLAIGGYFGWLFIQAIQSGQVTILLARNQRFFRRPSVSYWLVLIWYLASAAVLVGTALFLI